MLAGERANQFTARVPEYRRLSAVVVMGGAPYAWRQELRRLSR
jgi:hypothetical protein